MNRALLILVLLLIAAGWMPSTAHARDDFQYWSQYSVKLIDTKKFDLTTFATGRLMDDAGEMRFYYVSEGLAYSLHKNLGLGLNYTYVRIKTINNLDDSEFKFHHRIELETIPRGTFANGWQWSIRNRIEFRWIEDMGAHSARFRSRWALTFPLKNRGQLKDFYTSVEPFYLTHAHEISEIWVTPIGTTWTINDKVSLKVYYMQQLRKGTDSWLSNEVLGTTLSFKF